MSPNRLFVNGGLELTGVGALVFPSRQKRMLWTPTWDRSVCHKRRCDPKDSDEENRGYVESPLSPVSRLRTRLPSPSRPPLDPL
eukprot:1179791-Prorocentrum_minimum.AAC.1